ncbi:MAG TPA: N-acetylmuramic acid 6-phosphate etherase [Planctomycetota bacterium]|nr:N-acetylmuramic acid 6-phosphate etherase [Planctomycetota bacterium]HRR82825.1 N-acetylmuramic acid 6-phosphate etherase [Planctomycetota bacterium]HRT92947.1 N-acetylmuramic acid 6-phosphate etherase [Planctomycetota bacterium]
MNGHPLDQAATEQRNPASERLDEMSALEIVDLMNAQDHLVPAAVHAAREAIAQAVEIVVAAFRAGGRLFYLGAGTSGRLGTLDAAECPPTFGTDPEQVQAVIAGGREALVRAVEGAEDRAADAAAALRERGFGPADVLAGIAACGLTPFVRAGLAFAAGLGARTLFITCNPRLDPMPGADVVIALDVGPEVLTGSTRLKAGTATKLALNTLTTAAMVRLGKCYGNLMVDLRATNEKLRVRSVRILRQLCGLDDAAARRVLAEAGGGLKVAILMARRGLARDEAAALLAQHQGILRRALEG